MVHDVYPGKSPPRLVYVLTTGVARLNAPSWKLFNSGSPEVMTSFIDRAMKSTRPTTLDAGVGL